MNSPESFLLTGKHISDQMVRVPYAPLHSRYSDEGIHRQKNANQNFSIHIPAICLLFDRWQTPTMLQANFEGKLRRSDFVCWCISRSLRCRIHGSALCTMYTSNSKRYLVCYCGWILFNLREIQVRCRPGDLRANITTRTVTVFRPSGGKGGHASKSGLINFIHSRIG